MIQALALASFALLLIAGAIALWGGSVVREQQQRSLSTIDGRLAAARVAAEQRPLENLPTSEARKAPLWREVEALLLRAGLQPKPSVFIAIAVPGLILAGLAWWRIHSVWITPVIFAVYGAVVWLWLHRRIEELERRLVVQLPDFLDGLVRMASVGNSLPMAFLSTVKSVHVPLRTVLDRAAQMMQSGMDLDAALQVATRPYGIEEFKLLYSVLGIGMRIGGRADQIVQRMSDFMRDRSQAQVELKAITAETRLSSWVLGLLPLVVSLFMTMLNPTFFTPMFNEPIGQKILLIALGMEILGGFLLYKLAKSL